MNIRLEVMRNNGKGIKLVSKIVVIYSNKVFQYDWQKKGFYVRMLMREMDLNANLIIMLTQQLFNYPHSIYLKKGTLKKYLKKWLS